MSDVATQQLHHCQESISLLVQGVGKIYSQMSNNNVQEIKFINSRS